MILTEYQKVILKMIADGEPAKVVAAKLKRDEKVIENEICKMRRRYGVPNTVALCVRAVRSNLI